jgi:hypothetical protein
MNKLMMKIFVGGVLGEKYYEVAEWRYLPEYRSCPANNKLKLDYALIKLNNHV